MEDSWPSKSRERDLKSNKELIDLHPIPGKGQDWWSDWPRATGRPTSQIYSHRWNLTNLCLAFSTNTTDNRRLQQHKQPVFQKWYRILTPIQTYFRTLFDLPCRKRAMLNHLNLRKENSSFLFWPVARLFSRRRLAMSVVGRIKKGTSCVILHSIARIVEAMRKPGNWRPVVDCWPQHYHPHYRHSLAQHRLTPPQH